MSTAAKMMTSQHYLNDDVVAAKRAAKDYTVMLTPAFEYAGEMYQVVLDGNHSFAAAIEDGVEPMFVEATNMDCDYLHMFASDPAAALEIAWIDGDWIDPITRQTIW